VTAWLLAGYLAANGADAATTAARLRQPAVFHEGNPLLPSTVRGIVLTKVATGAATVYASALLKRKGHTRAAKAVYAIGMGIAGAAAVHNASLRR
jgi:hypothetical protein